MLGKWFGQVHQVNWIRKLLVNCKLAAFNRKSAHVESFCMEADVIIFLFQLLSQVKVKFIGSTLMMNNSVKVKDDV